VIADDILVIGNGRIVAQGTKQELLSSGETYARSSDPTSLGRALQRAGHTAEITTEGAVLSDADLTTVGQIAFDTGLVLTELRAADGAGLEEMFLQLTAETQRDHLETPEGLHSSKGQAA